MSRLEWFSCNSSSKVRFCWTWSQHTGTAQLISKICLARNDLILIFVEMNQYVVAQLVNDQPKFLLSSLFLSLRACVCDWTDWVTKVLCMGPTVFCFRVFKISSSVHDDGSFFIRFESNGVPAVPPHCTIYQRCQEEKHQLIGDEWFFAGHFCCEGNRNCSVAGGNRLLTDMNIGVWASPAILICSAARGSSFIELNWSSRWRPVRDGGWLVS